MEITRDLLVVLLIIFFIGFMCTIGVFGVSIVAHEWIINPWYLAMLAIGLLGLIIVNITILHRVKK